MSLLSVLHVFLLSVFHMSLLLFLRLSLLSVLRLSLLSVSHMSLLSVLRMSLLSVLHLSLISDLLLPLVRTDCPGNVQVSASNCFDNYKSHFVNMQKRENTLFTGVDVEILRSFCRYIFFCKVHVDADDHQSTCACIILTCSLLLQSLWHILDNISICIMLLPTWLFFMNI